MTEITDLNPVDESNTSLTGNGITGGNFVSNFDNAMRGLLGLLGRLNSGTAPISDLFTIADPADLTKQARFDTGLITPGQRRVITLPDQDITLGTGTASGTSFTPAGNIAATDVQAAIQELDTEKQPLNTQLTDIAALAVTDSNIIVGNGTTWVAESGATARTSLGLGTGNAPQFTAVNIGNATDTTISRASAGDVQVEGNLLYRAGGTDVPLADGGTGASLTDPNADRIMFWDDSGGAVTWLSLGTGLAFNVTSLDLDADLASWSAVTRASGFDTFTATPSIANLMSLLTDDASGLGTFMTTPSSANLRSLLTDETGTGVAVFGTSPGFTTAANPASNDGASLGTTTLNWSDVFVADGGVINWNNGDVTITHSSNALAFAGASSGYSFDAAVIAATVVGGTGAASALELKATTGNGVGSEYVKVTGGNNGAKEFARFVPNNSGGLLIGTTSFVKAITINSATDFDGLRFTVGSTSFDMAVGGSDVYLANLANGTLNLQTNSANRVTITGAGLVSIVTNFGRGAPVTKTANFTVADNENWLINNKSGSSCTVTLPTASSWTGREIMFKNSQAQTVVSASSNVVPRVTAAAGTAILASGSGNWCTMVSNGTNWVIMAGS